MLIFWLNSIHSQNIDSVIVKNNVYKLYPNLQNEDYMQSLSFWKSNIIKGAYNLNDEDSTDGQYVQFYNTDSTAIAKLFSLKNGKLSGRYNEYYISGVKESERFYLDGYAVGLHKNYYKSGSIKNEIEYRLDTSRNNGHIFENHQYHRSYYDHGKIKFVKTYDELGFKNGKWEEFYENGNLERSYTYSGVDDMNFLPGNRNSYGNASGDYVEYHENGLELIKLKYRKGILIDSTYCYYNSNGIKERCGYINGYGMKYGNWIFYSNTGQITSTGNFSTGIIDLCGSVPFKEVYSYKSGEWKYYDVKNKYIGSIFYRLMEKNFENGCQGGAIKRCTYFDKLKMDPNLDRTELESYTKFLKFNADECVIYNKAIGLSKNVIY